MYLYIPSRSLVLVHTYHAINLFVGCWKGSFKQCQNSSTGIRFVFSFATVSIHGLCHDKHEYQEERKIFHFNFCSCLEPWSERRSKENHAISFTVTFVALLRPLWHCDAKEMDDDWEWVSCVERIYLYLSSHGSSVVRTIPNTNYLQCNNTLAHCLLKWAANVSL